MNSKSIHTCENCGQLYCQECSDAEAWQKFCSKECEEEKDREKDEN